MIKAETKTPKKGKMKHVSAYTGIGITEKERNYGTDGN